MKPTYLLVAGLVCASSCIKISEGPVEIDPPPRPKDVPQAAQWCGGIDGGVFILLRGDAKSGLRGAIYADHTGYLWYEGPFQLQGTSKAPNVAGNKWCGGWDGTKIALRSGGALVATNLKP